MLIQSMNGDRVTLPDAGDHDHFIVEPAEPGGLAAYWLARVIAAREDRINLSPKVETQAGAQVIASTLEISHYWPGAPGDGAARPTGVGKYPKAKHYDLEEAGNGIQLGGGSKIGPDGPVDTVWVSGDLRGVPVVSQYFKSGLYNSDVVLSPTFELVYIENGAPKASPAPDVSTAVTPAPTAAKSENVSRLDVVLALVSAVKASLS